MTLNKRQGVGYARTVTVDVNIDSPALQLCYFIKNIMVVPVDVQVQLNRTLERRRLVCFG